MRKHNKVLMTVGAVVLAGVVTLSVVYPSSEYSRGQDFVASMVSPNGSVGEKTMTDNVIQRDAKFSLNASNGWYADPIWTRKEYLAARSAYYRGADQDTRAIIAKERTFKWPEYLFKLPEYFFNLGAADAYERWLNSPEQSAQRRATEQMIQSVTRAHACKDSSDKALFPAKFFGQSDAFAKETFAAARKYCAAA